MAFVLGNVGRLLANAKTVSAAVSGYTISGNRAVSEVTTMTDSGMRYVPGLATGSLSLRGPQDSTGQSLHSEVAAAVGVDNALLLTICPEGNSAGRLAYLAASDISEWAIDGTIGDAVQYSLTTASDEMVDVGTVLHGLNAETATGNSAGVDRLAASSNGATAVIHTTAYSGLTNAVVKVQHSTDNSTWADLVTFTTITATSAEKRSIPVGTTINRYVRATVTVTGTGSVTYLVALATR